MTEDELEFLFEMCLDEEEDLDDEKYEAAIRAKGGERFVTLWHDHHHESLHVEEDMIKFMKKQGFIVYDDISCEDHEMTGWVVFPPKGK